MNSDTEAYWTKRYQEEQTGWDIGESSRPMRHYIDQLTNKDLRILIPGAGNAYEAEYLHRLGYKSIHILDISALPLNQFQKRVPDFPSDHLRHGDFFQHEGEYDLILEQTFFCSFPPVAETRKAYAKKMFELLSPNGKLVGLWFDIPLTGDMENRPFGGDRYEYLSYFSPYFIVRSFESCYNSISPRQGSELFGIFQRRSELSS